jgi:hypothetical protein
MKFIRLTQVDQEWSGKPYTNMVSVNAESIRWLAERRRPDWLTENAPPAVTFVQLSGEGPRNDTWVKVLESVDEIEAMLA